MAKIRGIKPETWTDSKFVQLTPLARLLFIAMWNFTCDNGHLTDDPIEIKMRMLPADNCDIIALISELVDRGRVQRKSGFLRVPKLGVHQRVDSRYFTTCEWCSDDPDSAFPRREPYVRPTSARRVHDVSTVGARVDGDGDGDGDGDIPNKPGPRAHDVQPARKRAAQLTDDFAPNRRNEEIADEQGVDLAHELAKFRDYYRATGKPMKDWHAAFNNWLRNAKSTGRPIGHTGDDTPWMRRGLSS